MPLKFFKMRGISTKKLVSSASLFVEPQVMLTENMCDSRAWQMCIETPPRKMVKQGIHLMFSQREAKKVFSPDPEEVAFARKVIEAIPDGRGVHMIDGKMQDDATWKQCKVMVDLAEQLAAKDPELAEAYRFERAGAPA